MFSLIFSSPVVVKPFNSVIIHQIRFFSRDPFPNKVKHYLYRATLIDSIRLSLRSTTSDTTLPSLLNHRNLDSFVVKNALRSSPSVASAWFIFKTLTQKKKTHFSFETETLHAFATVLAKFQRSSELSSLIGVVNAGKFGQVHFSYMNLMNLYATAGDFDSVLKTWDEYRCSGDDEKKGCCTESYNIVMQVYMRLGKDSEAVRTFDQMINEGGLSNSRTFTIMIEHLLKLGNLDEAMNVFKTLPLMRITRTLKHYSVLVEAFVDAQRFGEVKTLLCELKADGKFPSRRMLEPLKRMREAGFEQETEEFLREMLPDERIKDISMYSVDSPSDSEDEGEEENDDVSEAQVKLKPWLDPKALANSLKKWSSDAVTALEEANFVWTNLLVCKMLRNFRSPETAWSFFCWVAIQPGYTHNAYTIERMMAMLARNGQVELVDKLISKVRMEGIKLPFSTIRLIIDLYGISKKPDAAIKVFRQDRDLCCSISEFNLMLLYSSLLRTLTKCKRNAEALETLEDMILRGVSPDIQTFSGLMYHFALQGEIQTVERLFSMVRQIGLEPDPYMLKLLVQAYCRCERSVLAYRVFQDMKDSNMMPDKETKELLVKSLWREEKRKEAAAVEERYEEGNNNNKNNSNVLRLALKGHVWTISSTDIARVHDLYRDCVVKSSS
ncbi:PREDICTED: pentatricopeptide repeat-containing protein At5g66631-like [Camelina sativa]|uniref:Pentatricopeptide repeat-containing protein At5g66631-like n=1 Tax=Camelina sativa TaxID=90675 RepID=A0ABM0W3H8_CAMSA|nr:PREDICTED: pentatricopeptide repeat-containing protein At5g66631-like [Camelina sativa]